jgi:amidase
MADEEVAHLPALEQARLIRTRDLSPVELVELYLRRIERIDASVGSMITVAADAALAAAKEAEADVSRAELSPFHGVPVVLKDVVDTAGIRSTYGSGAWKDRVPDRDHAVVTKLKAAGFIILGKTKTPEFSGGMVTEPIAFGPCRAAAPLEAQAQRWPRDSRRSPSVATTAVRSASRRTGMGSSASSRPGGGCRAPPTRRPCISRTAPWR